MAWVEEKSGIKFVDWGSLKPGHTEEEAVVFEKGKSYEALILRIITIEKKDKNTGDISNDYKFRLKMKDEEKEILLWSNAAIKRQHESLEFQEGEQIEITYVDDYDTEYGKSGRNIRVRVNRKE